MEFNLTDKDEELFFAIGTTINIGLFFIFILPGLVLCLLCVLALFLASSINWPVRIILINILAVEICNWLGLALLLLRFPVRANIVLEGDFSCHLIVSTFIANAVQGFSAPALYAIVVYYFIRYGVRKLKLYPIILYIAISWLLNVLLALSGYSTKFVIVESGVFCDSNSQAPFFGLILGIIILEMVVFSGIMIIFSVFTYCYMKNNTLESNVEVKRAIVKNLVYLLVKSVFSFVSYVLPVIYPIVRGAGGSNILVELLLLFYVTRVLVKLLSIFTPIVNIIVLRQICSALKNLFKCCCCKKNNAQ